MYSTLNSSLQPVVHTLFTHRVSLSKRRCVSSVFPASQSGRLSVSVCDSRLTIIKKRILGCRWSLIVLRLTLPRLVVLRRAYILMELRSITVSRDEATFWFRSTHFLNEIF